MFPLDRCLGRLDCSSSTALIIFQYTSVSGFDVHTIPGFRDAVLSTVNLARTVITRESLDRVPGNGRLAIASVTCFLVRYTH